MPSSPQQPNPIRDFVVDERERERVLSAEWTVQRVNGDIMPSGPF